MRPKTWDVLRYLAERPGQLVSKDELLQNVWPDVIVTDDTLTKSIGEIRSALGDDKRRPRLLETVPRRGFRFIAPVTVGPLAGSHVPAQPPAPQQRKTAFVGRAAERAHLKRCFERALAGDRQIVFIGGEPGIGKTALVESFVGDVVEHGSGSVIATTGCSIEQSGAREAYLPVLTALERLAQGPHLNRLVTLLRQFAPTWLAQVPWLSSAADGPKPTTELRAEPMLREFCTFIEAFTAEQALLIVLEDLHWCDPSTAELLAMLGQRQEPARLLIVGTFRPAELAADDRAFPRVKQLLHQRRQCAEVLLRDLDSSEVGAYVACRFPGCRDADEIARVVHDHTSGHPLFMAILLDDLVQRAWLIDTSPGWALTVPLAKADLSVPNDIRTLIGAQLESLSAPDQQLLEAASVVESDFTVALLATALSADVTETESACRRLVRTNRFLRFGRSTTETEATERFAFVHEIARNVVYDGIGDTRRRQLHQRVGEAIEAAGDKRPDEAAAELAAHFERSRDWNRAVHYLSLAAQRVARRCATREAITYLATAVEMAKHLTDAAQRDRALLGIQPLLSSYCGQLHGYASDVARRSYEDTRQLCDTVGTPFDRYSALCALWPSQAARGEKATVETTRQILDLAHDLGDAEAAAQAQVILGRTLFWQSRLTEAHDVLEGVTSFWRDRAGNIDASGFLEPPAIAVHFYAAVVLALLGKPARSRAEVERGLSVTEGRVHPFIHAGSYLDAAYVAHLYGDLDQVERYAQLTIEHSEEHGFPFWKAMALALLGLVSSHRGEPERGSELIQTGIDLHRTTGATTILSHMLAFLADTRLRLGDTATGLEAVEEGLELCGSTLDCVYEPELWRLDGELRLAAAAANRGGRRGRRPNTTTDGGVESLQSALRIARDRGAALFELRAAMSLVRHHAPNGIEALCAAYQGFEQGFDTADAQAARRLLEEGPASRMHGL